MPLAKTLLGFVFDNPLGRIAAAGAVLLALVASFAHQQRNIGAERAVVKQEKVNVEVKKRADSAARKSADPKSRGVRDPYAVSE